MKNQSNNFEDSEFISVLTKLKNINPQIGDFIKAFPNEEFNFAIKLSNGRIIIPLEIMQDRLSLFDNDERLKILAHTFTHNDYDNNKELAIEKNKSKKFKYKKLVLVTVLILIIIGAATFYFFKFKSPYKKGVENIKENNFNLALIEFQKIDSADVTFAKAISKINFIKGKMKYDSLDYANAYKFLTEVNDSDEFHMEAIELISKLKNNPNFIYDNGLYLLKQKKYNEALIEFQKIKPTEDIYEKTENNMRFINGVNAYKEKDYSLTFQYLESIQLPDDLMQEVNKILDDSRSSLDFETNKSYINSLISTTQKFNQELVLCKNYNANEIKLITLRNMSNIKLEFVNSKSYAHSEDDLILRYKDLYVQYMNSCINHMNAFLQALNLYGNNNILLEMYYGKTRNKYEKEQNTIYNDIKIVLAKINNKYGLLN